MPPPRRPRPSRAPAAPPAALPHRARCRSAPHAAGLRPLGALRALSGASRCSRPRSRPSASAAHAERVRGLRPACVFNPACRLRTNRGHSSCGAPRHALRLAPYGASSRAAAGGPPPRFARPPATSSRLEAPHDNKRARAAFRRCTTSAATARGGRWGEPLSFLLTVALFGHTSAETFQ